MLEKFENLSKSLDETYNTQTVVSCLRDFFRKNFNTDDLKIYVFDRFTNSLKDFSKMWMHLDDLNNPLYDIFDALGEKVIIKEDNKLYYALIKQKKIIGLIEFCGGINQSLTDFVKLASYQISLKVQNIILAESMQKNIDFHELMKNIAKIIETQYELNYIIPLLGEMIDKFMSNHLIYIFIKESGRFELLWPANCNDRKIYDSLKLIDEKSDFYLTDDSKTGVFPLINENSILGCIAAKSMGNALTNSDISYLEQLAKQSSTTINRANVYAEILKHATLDALTGFYNRRQLDERIKQETASAKRQKVPLCAIMTDIDFFKKVNDLYGHAAGDLVLKTVAKIMRSQLREYDIAGRYGGEEFGILLPFTKIDEAAMDAERLRTAVENKKIDLSKVNKDCETKIINVTISLGVYEFKSYDLAKDLLKKADKALYIAKESGRNRVIVNYD